MASASQFSKRPLAEWVEDLQRASSPDDRYRALLAINSVGKPTDAMHWCRQALQDTDSGVRALAAKQLGEWKRRGDSATAVDASTWDQIGAALAGCLRDEDPDVRFEAARALGAIQPLLPEANAVLLSFLDDEGTQPLMIAVVVTALGEYAEAAPDVLLPRLRTLLAHSQAEIRENVSAVIARSQRIAAALASELVLALDDDEPIVRENAAVGLGLSGNVSTDVMSALATAGQDEDEGVADAARTAHARLSGQSRH